MQGVTVHDGCGGVDTFMRAVARDEIWSSGNIRGECQSIIVLFQAGAAILRLAVRYRPQGKTNHNARERYTVG